MKPFVFSLDLEADYAGCADQYEIFKDPEKIEQVLSVLDSLGVKITVFVVGEIFERYPDVIRIFEKYNCEYESHSYSHNVVNPYLEDEIRKARASYFNYFKKYPKGYRVPQGRVSNAIIKLLERYGFLYDSSIFPSYYPNPFRYFFHNRNIHYFNNSNIMEIPITTITPFRLTLSLSYIKLLGIKFYIKLLQIFAVPNNICFSCHLHDFIVEEASYAKLSYFWKFIYSRNKFLGVNYCIQFLKHFKQKGYQFCFMSELYKLYRQS